MRRSSTFEQWRLKILPRGSILVTTHSGLSTALFDLGTSSDEDKDTIEEVEPVSPVKSEGIPTRMAENIEDDLEIGSQNAHADGEPPQAIVITPGQAACDVKPHVIEVLPTYNGKSYEGPYEFLHEFCKICKAWKRPAGSSEDDYRLKALPIVLKGEANTLFMRLPPNSIRTWVDFKLAFLDQFFPSTKTSALKKEIPCVMQDYDESLSDYWARYMSLLDACPNHRMSEVEIYNTFYEGMNKETKDLANSSARSTHGIIKLIGSSTLPPTEEPLRQTPFKESLGGGTFLPAPPPSTLKKTSPSTPSKIIKRGRSNHKLKGVGHRHVMKKKKTRRK